MRTRKQIMNTKRTNKEKLQIFNNYVEKNKNKISYKTYVMFNTTCNQLLNDYLTSRNVEILIDLKEHVMYIGVIYKYITQNHPSEPKLIDIKDKFKYYKEWIINESDMSL